MTYAEERLGLLDRLRRQGGGVGEALRLDGRSLRFVLGTSLADLRVPIAIDPALLAAAQFAARDLLFLLCLRHKSALRQDEYDHLLLLDGFDPQRHRPPSFTPPSSVASAHVSAAFMEVPELHPALDAGVMAAWIGQGRPGRALAGLLQALFKRAAQEERETDGREPTPYLALLALRAAFPDKVHEELRRIPIALPAGRVLLGAVAAGMLALLRLAARGSGALQSPSALRVEAALSPFPWLAGGRVLPGSGLHAYGILIHEPLAQIEPLAQKLSSGSSPEMAMREASRSLDLTTDGGARLGRAVAIALLRRELLPLLRLVESGRAPSPQLDGMTLAQLYGQPGALERTLASPERRKLLTARLKDVAKACAREADRTRVELLAFAAQQWREDDAVAWLASGDVQRAYSRAVVALAVDVTLEKLLVAAQATLLNRSGGEREGGIDEEHEGGRLYLFAADERPILRGRQRSPSMGHLFCDVKDFTRRTSFLKEAVVADFLSREFYTPILTAAARHHHGAGHLGDRGGIYLNNLLGDAISFSGDVVSLVELAHDIRRALQSYARRLESEASNEAVARSIAAIERAAAERRAQLLAELGKIRQTPGHEAHADEIERELLRVEEEREAELALARGEKLEAGIFISYGTAPEVATFEDAVFGAIKVSIAEKINESARGTARMPGVRARVDMLVAQARSARGRDDVVCPLSVAVSHPLTIPVAPGEETDLRSCVARGELDLAEQLLEPSVRRFVESLWVEISRPRGGDIYNGGAALSDEALEAYVESRSRDLLFIRRELETSALHKSMQERFVFPLDKLQFVAAISHTTGGLAELFVHVGRALFKGFEKMGGLGVWELVPAQSPFFALLAQHHVPAWMVEHQEGGDEPPLSIVRGGAA